MIALWHRARRAVGGIGDTEWALLIMESLGVVVSILIAFQLQEWAEDRREDRNRQRVIERLFDEAQANAIEMVDYHMRENRWIDRAVPVARILADGSCPGAEQFDDLSGVDYYPSLSLQSAVYDETVAGIGLSGLKDAELADVMNAYREEMDFTRSQQSFFRQSPSAIGDDFSKVIVTYDLNAPNLMRKRYKRDAICADPAFASRANSALRNQVVFSAYIHDLSSKAAHLCHVLGARVGRRCADPEGGLDAEVRDALLRADRRAHEKFFP